MRSLLLLAGVLLPLWMPAAWASALPWCVGLLAAAALCHARLRGLLLVAAGCLHAALFAQSLQMPMPEGLDDDRVLVHARVDSIPALGEAGWQFDAEVSFPRHAGWPARRLRMLLPSGATPPEVGEVWQYAARLEGPRDARARRALLRDHLSGSARAVDGTLTQQIEVGGKGLDRLRNRVARRMADRIADPSAAALLAALAVGVTGDVSGRQWQVFNATGITHLVAISGMHVTFFAMCAMAVARRVWRWLATMPGMPRRELFTAGVGVLLAFLYALLSGFSVPAQRTAIMLASFLLARELSRRTSPAWSVAAALVAVLCFDPMAALSAGFWLSFIAVAAIVLVAGARLASPPALAGAVQVQGLVTVALLPVTLAIFGSFSAVGVLANAIAIPVFTLLLVPPILVATACLLLPLEFAGWCGDRLVDLTALFATAVWPPLSALASLPAALWWADAPWCWYLLAPAAVALAVLPLRPVWRAAALVLLASVFLLREPRPREGELWIDVPDTGSAAVVVLRTRTRLLLWGSGEVYGSNGRRFARQVLPLLRAARYPAVDLWLPGSLDQDTQAALRSAALALPLREVMVPRGRGVPPEMGECEERVWQWDAVQFASHRAADGGCLLAVVTAGRQRLLLGAASAQHPAQHEDLPVMLLPRAASAAARLPVAEGQWLIAGLSASDWNAPAWQRQRERLRDAGALMLGTADEGRLRLRLGDRLQRRRLHEAGW